MRAGTHLLRSSHLLLIALAVLVAACGFFPEKVAITDPRVKPLLDATALVDRAALGFTPLDPNAVVRLETKSRGGYDAMLHVDGATSRTIEFRHKGTGYEWTGEQEIHRGPKTYTDVEGLTFPEEITITVHTIPGHGHTGIIYIGPDERLAGRQDLKLEDVKPILAEWNRAALGPGAPPK